MLIFLCLASFVAAELLEVVSLPGIGALSTKTIAGRVVTNEKYNTELFLLAFESQNNPESDPTVLWLQGGPGCSSQFGAFVEQGPYKIDGSGNFSPNPYAWNQKANLIYIDSPPPTGFSTTNSSDGFDSNEFEVSLDLYNALQQYFKFNNSIYRRTKQFFIAGESYAGKYVPYLGARIVNTTVSENDFKIPLVGMLLGNAWVDPQRQMKSYVPFLQSYSRISNSDAEWAQAQYPQFDAYLAAGQFELAADIDNGILSRLTSNAGINDPYNINDATDPTAEPTAALSAWLSSESVQTALNVPNSGEFVFCSQAAYSPLNNDEEQDAKSQLKIVLDFGAKVTCYNGVLDLICDYLGTANYTAVLGYFDQSNFNSAVSKNWTNPSNGNVAGVFKSAKSLALVQIDGSGHMVPFDQPESAYTMFANALAFSWPNM